MPQEGLYMINQKYTRIFDTEHHNVETAASIPDEGIALVFVKENDLTVVTQSKGVAGEVFAGVSLARNTPPLFVPFVYEGVVDSASGLELPRTPITGQILVRVDGAAATIVATVPASASEVQLVDKNLTFHAAANGKTLAVQFMYEPTVTEARQYKGDVAVGGLSATAQGVIGVITRGTVSTTYFNAGDDWTGALSVKLGADGMFTVSGPGEVVPNCTVMSSPSAGNPTLGLRIG